MSNESVERGAWVKVVRTMQTAEHPLDGRVGRYHAAGSIALFPHAVKVDGKIEAVREVMVLAKASFVEAAVNAAAKAAGVR